MICVDASVAVKWVLDEPDSDQALGLLDWTRQKRIELIAPSLVTTEVSNVIYRRMVSGTLSNSIGKELLEALLAIDVFLVEPLPYLPYKYDLADSLGIPTIYDALYVTVAQRFNCKLWTADTRLIRTVRGRLPNLRPLDAFTPDDTGSVRDTP